MINHDLLSIKGRLKFERVNFSGVETPQMGVSVNRSKFRARTKAVQNNLIDSAKFITMIFDVDQADVESVIVSHYGSVFNGGIFISDQTVDQVTYRPSYFNYLSREITSTSNEIDAASNCGCNEIDECAMGTHDCPAYANCQNFAGGYSCSCKTGFKQIINNGQLSCLDINECLSALNTCHSDATCANTVGSFECDCNVGFNGDGKDCQDVDECAIWELSQCQENSDCVNYAGGYACVCQDGFSGDGRLVQGCQDKDECVLRTANCPDNSQCFNIEGGFICKCDEGFENHHGVCVDIDECGLNLDDCHPMAECTNLAGGYNCECVGPDWSG